MIIDIEEIINLTDKGIIKWKYSFPRGFKTVGFNLNLKIRFFLSMYPCLYVNGKTVLDKDRYHFDSSLQHLWDAIKASRSNQNSRPEEINVKIKIIEAALKELDDKEI